MRGGVLVTAKAPVAGRAKTRLAGVAGPDGAAGLAAAALLDTLEAAGTAFPEGRRVLALDGDLGEACRSEEIVAAIRGWAVVPQAGGSFGERLAQAHRAAHRLVGGPVVQVGMDTPQVRGAELRLLVDVAVRHGGPVLGPALDGGWWVLVTTDPRQAAVLTGVPMSRPDTGRLTAAALAAAGHPAVTAATVRDVDLPEDAEAVAALAPGSRFAAAWRAVVDARSAAPSGRA
ncbi:TIGR04282 family arsenosugar biosynthesis glycosyltransferase [Phycicoccus avicenniae]|uniref:TIGR04282 family arsenosugar biosynthesis glycosyltransferase n=1 Tax=Phycicoccus avicenniae TaxID=2828860 RepID=UPI003D2A1C9D